MGEECNVECCQRPVYSKGMCEMHYRRVLRRGDSGQVEPITREKSICVASDCDKDAEAWGYCHGHYQRLLRNGVVGDEPFRSSGRLCSVPDCGRAHKALGYCPAHYKRFLATGDPEADRPIREVAGDGHVNHGYWVVPVPRAFRWLVGGAKSIDWSWPNFSDVPSGPTRWSTTGMASARTIGSRTWSCGRPLIQRDSG